MSTDMAVLVKISVCVLLLCGFVSSSDVLSVFNDVRHCFRGDFQPCLVGHAVDAIIDVAGLQSIVNETQYNESSIKQLNTVEGRLARALDDAIRPPAGTEKYFEARGSMLRTFNKAWKYLIPMLMGVMLKLGTFMPIVLTVLTLIAKSAFLSGKMALLLTGLNIALKYWYPKWSSEQTDNSLLFKSHGYDHYLHQPSNMHLQYAHNLQELAYGHQDHHLHSDKVTSADHRRVGY